MLYRLALIVPYLYSECAAAAADDPHGDALFLAGIDFNDENDDVLRYHVTDEDRSSKKSRVSPHQNYLRGPKLRKTTNYAESEKEFDFDDRSLRDLDVVPDDLPVTDPDVRQFVAKPRTDEIRSAGAAVKANRASGSRKGQSSFKRSKRVHVSRRIDKLDRKSLEPFYLEHMHDVGASASSLAAAYLKEHHTVLLQTQLREWFGKRSKKNRTKRKFE